MASFLRTDLPSEDEEDDDYNPEADNTAEAKDKPQKQSKAGGRRRRPASGSPALDGAAVDGAEATGDTALSDEDQDHPQTKAKKARTEQLWQLLNSRPGAPSQSAALPSTSKTSNGSGAEPAASSRSGAALSLASLCRPVSTKSGSSDTLWMRSLGLAAPSARTKPCKQTLTGATSSQAPQQPAAASAVDHQQQPPESTHSEPGGAAADDSTCKPETTITASAKAAAAAALTAAREAASLASARGHNKVSITETRRFAGKDIQVSVQVDKDSKEAAKATETQKAPASGLDAFLAEVAKKKKVNVLEKSKMDWQDFKQTDNSIDEELETYKKSSNKYLDKVEFLQRAELREYELERDKRLASDVRNRGRL